MNKQTVIKWLEDNGACYDAIDWVEAQPGTVKQIYANCNDLSFLDWLYWNLELYAEATTRNKTALADYNAIVNPALADYNTIVNPARADFEAIVNPARADFEAIKAPAYADYVQRSKLDWQTVRQALKEVV